MSKKVELLREVHARPRELRARQAYVSFSSGRLEVKIEAHTCFDASLGALSVALNFLTCAFSSPRLPTSASLRLLPADTPTAPSRIIVKSTADDVACLSLMTTKT